ncbi:MAG: hypothetical protein ACI37S_00840 [Candidatus Gastranaerophilaceae bacterium]
MNYKAFLTTLLIVLVVATLFMCVTKPKLHHKVLVYNSDYVIVQPEVKSEKSEILPVKQVEVSTKDIKTTETKTVEKVPVKQSVKESNKVLKTVKTEPKVENSKSIQKVESKTNVEPKIIKNNNSNVQKTEKVVPQTKTITQTQEEIEWNKWRSNLQNQIMSDVDLVDVPQGIVFKFTFDVDKYGKVSNVKTWSTTPSYTPHAIQYIAPVIKGYQGRSILNFPSGSNRTVVHFDGGIKISNYERYSTPQDYNDTERVIK